MTVTENWDRLKNYWQIKLKVSSIKCNGATDEEIAELEMKLQLKLPQSYIDSLKICNQSYFSVEEGSRYAWFGAPSRPLSIRDVIFTANDLPQYYVGMKFEDIYGDIVEPESKWPDGWVPILGAFQYFGMIDLRPGIGDQYGQVLLSDPVNGKLTVWAKSYEEFFNIAVNTVIKSGGISERYYEKKLHLSHDIHPIYLKIGLFFQKFFQ